MKKAVLFDLDNTLYDYDPVHFKALKAAHFILNKHIKLSFKGFIALYDLSKRELHKELAGTASAHNRVLYFQRLIEKTHKTVNPRIILQLYNGYWNTSLKYLKLRKNVLKTFKQLKKQNIKIAIVTDLTTHIQLRKIKKLKIAKYTDFLITSEEAGSEKPHSIMFLLALNKLKILPKDALMVGDNTVTDIEGANAVGIQTVLISKNKLRKQKEDYRNPTYQIRDIKEVLNLL